MPSEYEMMKIYDAIKLADPKKRGFIISLQERSPVFAKIKEENLPNVYLSSWVPQKELLLHKNLQLFILD